MTDAYSRTVDSEIRAYEFEFRSASRDGRRLVGTVAMFNKRARIPDRSGDFEEMLHAGFMKRSLRDNGMPVMQFDHGKDPRTGTVPIGVYDYWDETRSGYDVEGDLFDNAVVEPIRQAIAGRAVKGMSFRFHVVKNGDKWERRSGRDGMDLRHVIDADVPEGGPVVFPAYRDTAVAVRSLWAALDPAEQAELRQLAGMSTDLTGQPATRSGGGGDNDDESWEDEASPSTTSKKARAALAHPLSSMIVLPQRTNNA
jgi:phage head maturation protease